MQYVYLASLILSFHARLRHRPVPKYKHEKLPLLAIKVFPTYKGKCKPFKLARTVKQLQRLVHLWTVTAVLLLGLKSEGPAPPLAGFEDTEDSSKMK